MKITRLEDRLPDFRRELTYSEMQKRLLQAEIAIASLKLNIESMRRERDAE
jgi:hypothetical protein